MDSLQKPNRENSTCLPFWLYSCQRCWNGTFRKWHAAGFLYLYTRNKLERFLKCGGQSGGPPMFATLKQQVHKHFSMGQGKGKNSALQPHPQQRTSHANSTRHALLVSATFQFRSSVIALPQKAKQAFQHRVEIIRELDSWATFAVYRHYSRSSFREHQL